MIPDKAKAVNAAVAWWHSLKPNADRGTRGNPAALARLRRAATVMDLMAEPEAIDLFRCVGARSYSDLPVAALLAGVLSHVREDHQARSVARLLGPKHSSGGKDAIMSPLRFHRLLQTTEPDEILVAFRRMIALARGSLPVTDLSRSLLDWNEERKRRWIYDYWNAGTPNTDATRNTDTVMEEHSQ
jgi:CRISPR system Cascade subunit CasB